MCPIVEKQIVNTWSCTIACHSNLYPLQPEYPQHYLTLVFFNQSNNTTAFFNLLIYCNMLWRVNNDPRIQVSLIPNSMQSKLQRIKRYTDDTPLLPRQTDTEDNTPLFSWHKDRQDHAPLFSWHTDRQDHAPLFSWHTDRQDHAPLFSWHTDRHQHTVTPKASTPMQWRHPPNRMGCLGNREAKYHLTSCFNVSYCLTVPYLSENQWSVGPLYIQKSYLAAFCRWLSLRAVHIPCCFWPVPWSSKWWRGSGAWWSPTARPPPGRRPPPTPAGPV